MIYSALSLILSTLYLVLNPLSLLLNRRLQLSEFDHCGDAFDYRVLAVGVRFVAGLEVHTEDAAECLPEACAE